MGPPSCRRESIDSSIAADVRIDFKSIRACPRTNAMSRALLFETPAVPRYIAYPAFVLLRPRTTLRLRRRHRRRPAGTRSAKQGVSQGEHLEGNAAWPASPSPGGCNLLLRDPADLRVGLLPRLCLPPSLLVLPFAVD